MDPLGLDGKEIYPDMTVDFVKRLIKAAQWSENFSSYYETIDKKWQDVCESQTRWQDNLSCITAASVDQTVNIIEKYWEYQKKAFTTDKQDGWNVKAWAYKDTYHIWIWWQLRNNDDAGNFLVWYTLLPANISLDIIIELSKVNASYNILNGMISNWKIDTKKINEQWTNEIHDDKIIALWYQFFQQYGTNITSDILTEFLK